MGRVSYAGRTAISFVTFNLGWWACALGASHGLPWVGPVLMPLWVGIHMRVSPVPLGELIFFLELGATGWAVDSILIWLGLFTMATPTQFAPLWLVAMWVLLGLTYEGMLGLRNRPRLLLAMGGFSGPLSYIWCEAVELLTYARPLWIALAIHGLIWVILTPLLFRLRDHAILAVMPRPTLHHRHLLVRPQPERVDLPEPAPPRVVEPDHYKDPTVPTWH